MIITAIIYLIEGLLLFCLFRKFDPTENKEIHFKIAFLWPIYIFLCLFGSIYERKNPLKFIIYQGSNSKTKIEKNENEKIDSIEKEEKITIII
jgi:hypothetical protein